MPFIVSAVVWLIISQQRPLDQPENGELLTTTAALTGSAFTFILAVRTER